MRYETADLPIYQTEEERIAQVLCDSKGRKARHESKGTMHSRHAQRKKDRREVIRKLPLALQRPTSARKLGSVTITLTFKFQTAEGETLLSAQRMVPDDSRCVQVPLTMKKTADQLEHFKLLKRVGLKNQNMRHRIKERGRSAKPCHESSKGWSDHFDNVGLAMPEFNYDAVSVKAQYQYGRKPEEAVYREIQGPKEWREWFEKYVRFGSEKDLAVELTYQLPWEQQELPFIDNRVEELEEDDDSQLLPMVL